MSRDLILGDAQSLHFSVLPWDHCEAQTASEFTVPSVGGYNKTEPKAAYEEGETWCPFSKCFFGCSHDGIMLYER